MKAQDISDWLSGYLTKRLSLTPDQIDLELSFDSYGIDSQCAAELVGDLGEWLKTDLDLNVIYDYESIHSLSNHLAETVRE